MNNESFIENMLQRRIGNTAGFSNKQSGKDFIDGLFNFLFLTPWENDFEGYNGIATEYNTLEGLFFNLLSGVIKEDKSTSQLTRKFFEQIPFIYNTLFEDAEAILAFDPAARSLEEVLITYPGFYVTAVYRISHFLWEEKVPVLPRLFANHAHSITGIDIHPGAKIGKSFAIDHGTGIVIGETTVIGNNVKIYQGVTLGALNVTKSSAGTKRHPTIADDVIIYAGATILGGETLVGSNSIIGGNVWLTYSVPSFSVVYQKSEIKVRDNNPFPEPLNFNI